MKTLKKWQKIALIALIVLTATYFWGKSPRTPTYDLALSREVPSSVVDIATFVANEETKHILKPDNKARIVWANDSLRTKTAIAVVYLHGFSASQEEGNPVHRQLARKLGANLYLSRLSQHGIDTVAPLQNLTVDRYWESVKIAYQVGKTLGDKVLLVGCSTGGTFNLLLAASYPDIVGIINLSPNVAINDPSAFLLNNPWGLQLARIVIGGDFKTSTDLRASYKQYWNSSYRLEALCELQELIETKMNSETFKKVKVPTLNLYYFKNEQEQDDVVKVEAIKTMHEQLGTESSLKVLKALPTVGDHVLGGQLKSKDVNAVSLEMERFCCDILHLPMY